MKYRIWSNLANFNIYLFFLSGSNKTLKADKKHQAEAVMKMFAVLTDFEGFEDFDQKCCVNFYWNFFESKNDALYKEGSILLSTSTSTSRSDWLSASI